MKKIRHVWRWPYSGFHLIFKDGFEQGLVGLRCVQIVCAKEKSSAEQANTSPALGSAHQAREQLQVGGWYWTNSRKEEEKWDGNVAWA